MRVGIFLGGVQEKTGGEYTFQEGLMRSLERVEAGHDIFVFYYGRKSRPASAGRVTYVPLLDNFWVLRQLKRGLGALKGRASSLLQQAADRYRIDLMWFPSLHFVPLDLPYICTVLDLEHRVHPFFPEVSSAGAWQDRERFYGSMVPRAAYTICGTEAGRQQVIDFYHSDQERVRVVPFPVSPFAMEQVACDRAFLDKHGLNRPYLFYPAQFWPHKNHVALLQAVKLLRERQALDVDAVFCGADKGNLAHVRETARELGLESRVRFLGFVTQQELYALYRDAFALVYPSMFGPDNLPPLEAFAIGCPVIAARVAGAVEQLGDAALLVDPRHEEEIAAAVLRLQEDPDLRQALVLRGRERAERWTARDYVGAILALCDEFAGYRRCWSGKEKYVHG